MIKSGLKVPTPEMPMPDLAVPYAAPIAEYRQSSNLHRIKTGNVHPKIIFARDHG